MPREPKIINNIFKNNSVLSKMAKHAQLLNRLNHIFQQSLPAQFSAHCKLANINGETLVIHTDNASYSSLLRFQSPVLCKALSRELEVDIKKLEVKVRRHFASFEKQPLKPMFLPESAANSLQQTADSMDEGPLKIALEKLATRKI